MIGLVATLLAGIILGKWAFALSTVPYIMSAKNRGIALLAFYIYVLALIPFLPEVSLYEKKGAEAVLFVGLSTFLLLDEVLRKPKVGRDELITSAVLIPSALNNATFLAGLVGAFIYIAYRRFGKLAIYLYSWMGLSAIVLYALRDYLGGSGAQALAVIGLALATLLLGERRDVKFSEVKLIGRKE